MKIIPEKRRAH